MGACSSKTPNTQSDSEIDEEKQDYDNSRHKKEDTMFQSLKHQFVTDMEMFILNQLVMSVMFFEDFET